MHCTSKGGGGVEEERYVFESQYLILSRKIFILVTEQCSLIVWPPFFLIRRNTKVFHLLAGVAKLLFDNVKDIFCWGDGMKI